MNRLADMLLIAGITLLLNGCAGARSSAGAGDGIDASRASESPSDSRQRSPRGKTEAYAHFATGLSYQLNQEPEKALDHFHRAALADPSNEPLVLDLARRFLQNKEHEKAIELLQEAEKYPGASGEIFAWLARAHGVAGQTNAAFKAARKAIQTSPDSFAGYQILSDLHLGNRKPAEALKVLQRAEKQSGTDHLFLINLAEVYLAFCRAYPEEAERLKPRIPPILTRAAALDVQNPNLRQRLADLFQLAGDSESAVQVYLELLDEYSDLPLFRDLLREKLANLYLQNNDAEKAAEQLEALISDSPTRYPQAWYLLGTLAYQQQNFPRAAEYFDKALLLNPNVEQVYYDLAGMQINSGNAGDALRTLDRAREKFPQRFPSEFLAALACTRLKDYSKALQHFTAAEVIARATDPQRLTPQFYFQLGATYERNKDYEQAEKYFQRVIEMEPDFSEALNYLGYMWADLGVNLPEARELIEKAVKIEPESAAYLDSLGWVLFRLNQPREALHFILQAIVHSDEPDATIYDHLGDIYLALGEEAKAREAWEKSVRIESNPEVKEKLEKTAPTGGAPH